MKVSVIVATRNRGYAIAACLDSIAAALAHAAPLDAEIVVVDNGSEDATAAILKQWANNSPFVVRLLFESRRGQTAARNLALRVAIGELLVFTDDDCRLSKEYICQAMRYDASDGNELVLRGGRVELGDPTDLPLTTKTDPSPLRFFLRMEPAKNPIKRDNISGQILGCNMVMRRVLVQQLGPFDERFGPGTALPAGDESDYLFRAYLAGITIEYVPDMTVYHFHGRKQKAAGYKLLRGYCISNGALYAKYFVKHPNLCRPLLWDFNQSLKEISSGANTFLPVIDFSYKHKVAYAILGAAKYCFTTKKNMRG